MRVIFTLLRLTLCAAMVSLPATLHAQAIVKADQGRPGNQGAWPVTAGAAAPVTVMPGTCATVTQSVCSVTNVAATCPAAQLASRRYVVFCPTLENQAAGQVVKVNVTGAAVLGVANAGSVMGIGDCIMFQVPDTTLPSLISNSAGGVAVSVFQCS